MPTTLNLTPEVHVFPCPSCRETINTSASSCQFCGASIDRAAAEQSAAHTSIVSSAVSDASYLKIMLGAYLIFLPLSFVPFLGLAGLLGFTFLRYALPIMCIRWWWKYSRLDTLDPDFPTARRRAIYATAGAIIPWFFSGIHVFTH